MQSYIAGIIPVQKLDHLLTARIIFSGCNFNCPFCVDNEIVKINDKFLIDIKDVKEEIRRFSPVIDAVVYSGGEPTLQNQALITIMKFSKKLGLKNILETNGTKPIVLENLLSSKVLDTVILKLKSSFNKDIFERATRSQTFFKTTDEIMSSILSTLKVLEKYGSQVNIQVQMTVVPGLIYKKEDFLDVVKILKHNNLTGKFVIRPFNPNFGLTLDKRYNSLDSPSKDFMLNLSDTCRNVSNNIIVESRDY